MATAAGDHRRSQGGGEPDRRGKVHAQHLGGGIGRDARERTVPTEPGVVDQQIDVAGPVQEPLEVASRRKIGNQHVGPASACDSARPSASSPVARTRTPRRAIATTVARPIPLEAPVIKAVDPASFMCVAYPRLGERRRC